jgi:hypothetical protein
VTVLIDSPWERIGKRETCLIVKEDRSLAYNLARASATKTDTFLGVSRATVPKVMSAYTNHEKTISAKRNGGWKSTLTERDRCTFRSTLLENHRPTAAQVTAELNIHCEDPISTETVRRVNFTNPTSTIGLQLLNL